MSEVAFSLDNPFPGLRAFTENDADQFPSPTVSFAFTAFLT